MTTGERLKYIRKYREIYQQSLGEAIGFPDSSAGIRISQYESNTRYPKKDICVKLANVLKCDYKIFYNKISSFENFVLTLILAEELEGDSITTEKIISFLDDLQNMKALLQNKKISKEEYFEWKINYLSQEKR